LNFGKSLLISGPRPQEEVSP